MKTVTRAKYEVKFIHYRRKRVVCSAYFEKFRSSFGSGRRLSFLLSLFQFSFYFRFQVAVVVQVLVRLLQSVRETHSETSTHAHQHFLAMRP